MMIGPSAPTRGAACILVVEDNDQLRKAICEVLAETLPGIFILEAGCCEDASKFLLESLPDIILTDICLPGKNGLALAEEVKSKHPHIPVVIHTHYNMPEYREAAEAIGVDLFLVKGKVHLDRLSQLIGEFLTVP
ncbi:response regulator [Desulfococcus sp.]|uniref:response regulator n=1 Tax=Desulfococcus sp. TaxID=2025834 RepID=UPI003594260B